jgi:HlyD family secretion protein
MISARIVAGFAVMALLGEIVYTQEASQDKQSKSEAAAPAQPKPATHKVEKKPFKIELTVKGILEPEEMAEISYRPQPMIQPPPSQGPLIIRTIVDHGSTVKKGDVLAAFDTRKIDEVIEDLEKDKKLVEASIKLAEQELPLFEKSVPVDLASAETAKKRADEELKYWLEIGRGQFEKQIDMTVKSYKFYKEYAEEELKQLEKMYKANDLTEETEKIILRRQQNSVEMNAFYYQSMLIQRDYMLNFGIPNREKALKEDQVKSDLQLEKARKTLGPTLTQKQLALVKMHYDRDKANIRLERILKDRAAMTMHSPMDGVAYHGKFHKGRWTASESLETKLAPNGTVFADEVFLTVLKPRPVVIHMAIDEKDVHLLKVGSQGTAKTLFNPDRKLPAKVAKLASLPALPGKFDAQVALDIEAADANLMPGMACSVKFVPYSKPEAITVPNKTIHEEDDRFVVYVVSKNGKQEKRDVSPGRTDGEQTEILAGLREGEEVLLDRPGPKTAGKSSTPTPETKKGKVP